MVLVEPPKDERGMTYELGVQREKRTPQLFLLALLLLRVVPFVQKMGGESLLRTRSTSYFGRAAVRTSLKLTDS